MIPLAINKQHKQRSRKLYRVGKIFKTKTMPVDNYETFTYIGYTEGEIGSPTLYFNEGRYTQSHKNKDNIGWHPRKKYHRGANIKKDEHDWYRVLRKKKDTHGKNAFKAKFLNGDFDSSEPTARLFECSSDNNITWTGHPSRSRLVKTGDKGFNEKYNAEYAKGILANGVIAPNEQ